MSDDEAVIRGQGPCAFCGAPYAYHRTSDTQMGRVVAGEEIGDVAWDYGQTVEQMVAKWAALVDVLLYDLTGADR